MDALSLINFKGGVGKSTLTPILAAAIKVLYPNLRVGIIAADSSNGTLAAMYSKDLEHKNKGLWDIIDTMFGHRTKGRTDLLEEAIRSSVRTLTVVPGESNVPRKKDDFEAACQRLGITPNMPLEARQIEFICTAKELGKQAKYLPDLHHDKSAERVGGPLLKAIERTLGWDICLLDLPGEADDCLVKSLSPWCTCVVILSDVYKGENLLMEEDTVVTLRSAEVEPAGFLANKLTDTAPSEEAMEALGYIANRVGLPVLGSVRHLPLLATANRAYDAKGNHFIPENPKWKHPEGGWHVGLYRAALDFTKNDAIRDAATAGVLEIEKAAKALLAKIPELSSVGV